MAKQYSFDENKIYIHFSSDQEDINSGKYFKQDAFENISYFKRKI